MIFEQNEELLASYYNRSKSREVQLMRATMDSVSYFVGKGFDFTTANSMVVEISTETSPFSYIYILGNKQPLINKINNSVLAFMDTEAKEFITSKL